MLLCGARVTALPGYPLRRDRAARYSKLQIFTRCMTAQDIHACHLFSYNDLSALRAFRRARYTVPEEGKSSVSRAARIAWIIARLGPSASRLTSCTASSLVDKRPSSKAAHKTSILYVATKISMLGLVLTDLDMHTQEPRREKASIKCCLLTAIARHSFRHIFSFQTMHRARLLPPLQGLQRRFFSLTYV